MRDPLADLLNRAAFTDGASRALLIYSWTCLVVSKRFALARARITLRDQDRSLKGGRGSFHLAPRPINRWARPMSLEAHRCAMWGWTTKTSPHALRLVVAGVFERHPDARVILGHRGERLPFYLGRYDSRYATMRLDDDEQPPSGSSVWRRKATTIASSFADSTVEAAAFGPVGRSAKAVCALHLAAAFGWTP